jgi:hypothetical protein
MRQAMRDPRNPGQRSFFYAFAASFAAAVILVAAIGYFKDAPSSGTQATPFLRAAR